jgi:RND family efflux transporter MFP subunit
MDFDRLEAEFRNTRTALEAARQELSYTRLEAPFAGTVARRYAENFEQVQAKQVIMDLQDTAQLEVAFNVPEQLIRSLRGKQCQGQAARHQAVVSATFDEEPGRRFPLTFLEASTRADPSTQAFEVTYRMPRSDDLTILPGMTANVTVDLNACATDDAAVIRLPVTAVTADAELRSRVWIVDESSLTVQARPVETGNVQGDMITITGGVEPGERVVTAGAAFLAEGMRVTLLAQTEQATPRPDE